MFDFYKIINIKQYQSLLYFKKLINKINTLEPIIKYYSNKELQNYTILLKHKLKNGKTLDSLIPEAFAVVRESSKRILGLRHYDQQLLGGIVLHYGYLAEIATGEGKTLTATLPIYLNALINKGIHVITINDYLAKRDAELNTPLFNFLGLKVGLNISNLSIEEKQKAYDADITYGTNNEFVFDFLNDKVNLIIKNMLHKNFYYAIIDEIDTILIDEARTPFILSTPLSKLNVNHTNNIYIIINQLIKFLKKDIDFIINKHPIQLYFTKQGFKQLETLLIKFNLLTSYKLLYTYKYINILYLINLALQSKFLYKKNIHYIIKHNKIMIIDNYTGRLMDNRKWNKGLHQAIEAKEKLNFSSEANILTSITFKNFFKLYTKLAGMSGTLTTEAYELKQHYGLKIFNIPTHKPLIRKDYPDKIYLNQKAKITGIIKDITNCISKHRPVLIGTNSIKQSEMLSNILLKLKIKHNLLNAKYHEKEANIISQAGYPGIVTIATNMAGRGTDIMLGGNINKYISINRFYNKLNLSYLIQQWQYYHNLVVKCGGLHIIGTEKHELKRIDNQLKGRAGRQGDPGSSIFYISLDDKLIKRFIPPYILHILKTYYYKNNLDPLPNNGWLFFLDFLQFNLANYYVNNRKQLEKFEDCIQTQRNIIWQQRTKLLLFYNLDIIISKIQQFVITKIINKFSPYNIYNLDKFYLQINKLEQYLNNKFQLKIKLFFKLLQLIHNKTNQISLKKNLLFLILKKNIYMYSKIMETSFYTNYFNIEKNIILLTLDKMLQEHTEIMEYVLQGIHLQYYANKNPKQEYLFIAFKKFNNIIKYYQFIIIQYIWKYLNIIYNYYFSS